MKRRTGVYLIGALGSISTTVVAGASALRKRLSPPTGMITRTEIFDGLELVDVDSLKFGGCDIRKGDSACPGQDFLEQMGVVNRRILDKIKTEVEQFQNNIHKGTALNCGEAIQKLAHTMDDSTRPLRQNIEEIRGNLRSFRKRHRLDLVIVVNLASTEPPLDLETCHHEMTAFETIIDQNQVEKVRASTLYAYAAIQEGCPYINFTPSNGALPPALVHLARKKGVPVMGSDGKTGETLVKSALAPMFSYRNLEVMSWSGFNILGNMDGHVLNHPGNKESKIRTKDQVLSKILGYSPHSKVSIDYVPSLDDQKTAWDFIHFKGFMEVKMSMQFIWQGYDSILAAPLVLDMVRLAELAHRQGEAGLMCHLAPFFKAPLGVDEHRFSDQFSMLVDYVNNIKNDGHRMYSTASRRA